MNKSGFLPSRFAINDQLTPLGKLVEKDLPSTEPCEFRIFERTRLGWVETEPGKWMTIDEEDCRQVKAAPVATPQSAVDEFCARHAPPKEGEWIAHDGGPCPVAAETIVVCRSRNGREYRIPDRADTWGENLWKTDPRLPEWPDDIVAYRVIK